MSIKISWAVLAWVIALGASLQAEEMYIVQGAAGGAPIAPATSILWSTDALFVNTGATDATVQLLGTSNGGWHRGEPTVLIPPGRSASLTRTVGGNLAPVQPAILWVLRADVPAGVEVESLLFIGSVFDSGAAPPFHAPYRFGKARLPVFKDLVPTNERQYHLGTYLGDPVEIPSRLNVAVFNGGDATANARIEVRQHCDDAIIDTMSVAIPPETLLQFSGFQTAEDACPEYIPGTLGGPPNAIYTVVTVDQPSISFTTSLANREIPTTSIALTIPAR